MVRINNVRVGIDDNIDTIKDKLSAELKLSNLEISKKAIDARRKGDIHYVYSFDANAENEGKLLLNKYFSVSKIEPYVYEFPRGKKLSKRPVIVGTGPAGLFAGLVLAQNGYEPIILERGKCVESRVDDVNSFWEKGEFCENSNVQFGEGGAGTFSDGKLTTNIKDFRIRKVLDEFVKHGAAEEILYLSKPHIGTDRLRTVVKSIREEIISLGGDVRFENKLEEIVTEKKQIIGAYVQTDNSRYFIDTDSIILATGHSARDTLKMLKTAGVNMRQKPFSVGCRIEHSQDMISHSQYGEVYKRLPPADYKTAVHLPNGRSVYTFCMCVGGFVIQSASEKGHIVTNGMSNFDRGGKNANSAILVNIRPEDFGSKDVLAGIEFQRKIESRAFEYAGRNYKAPAQLVGDFLAGKVSLSCGGIVPTIKPGVVWGNIADIMPDFVTLAMREGLILMNKKIEGFTRRDAVLTAPETRSSSPVWIMRNRETMELNIKGLYSAGEGGGHAGGITSAAVDGIKCAEKLVLRKGNERKCI